MGGCDASGQLVDGQLLARVRVIGWLALGGLMNFGYSVTSGETQLAPAVVLATAFVILAFVVGLLRQVVLSVL